MDCRPKKCFKLVWRCRQLLSGFLAKGHLSPVSRHSRLSANDNDDNEVILGYVHRSPGIYLTAEEHPGKPHLMKDVRAVIASDGVPYFHMTSVGSHRTSVREKEGEKERTGSPPLRNIVLTSLLYNQVYCTETVINKYFSF
jgi:hypothetical protein